MKAFEFPDLYMEYNWKGKHHLFGYPADVFPSFEWIASLEKRFKWLRENSEGEKTASIYLIREMIEWGGSQNGVLQKFNDRCGEFNLHSILQEVIGNLEDPRSAITSALKMPGLGLTYASKLLRFFNPEKYCALDSRIRAALLRGGLLSKIHDGNTNSMVNGYLEFLGLIGGLQDQLAEQEVVKPRCALSSYPCWNPAQVEMALFRWAELNNT